MRVLVLALSLLVAVPAFARASDEVNARIDTVLGDHTIYEEAIHAIQHAVAEADAAAVAAWVAYPITVTAAGEEVLLENEEQFIERYDDVMTDDIVEAVTTQAYGELFVNMDGIMFGDGQVWVNGICKDDACTDLEARIIAIQSTAE